MLPALMARSYVPKIIKIGSLVLEFTLNIYIYTHTHIYIIIHIPNFINIEIYRKTLISRHSIPQNCGYLGMCEGLGLNYRYHG